MKTKLAIFVAGLLTATGAQYLTRTTPRGTTLSVVNAELLFPTVLLDDGGVRPTAFRACGYEHRIIEGLGEDGGSSLERIAEPCWKGELPQSLSEDLADALLSAGVK